MVVYKDTSNVVKKAAEFEQEKGFYGEFYLWK